MRINKKGYPSRKKNAFEPTIKIYKQIARLHVSTEKSLKDEFMEKFGGRCSEMFNSFMREAVKMQPRIVLEMDFSDGEPEPDPYYGKYLFQLDKKTEKIIGAYESLADAEAQTGVSKSGIGNVARGRQKTAGGYKWKWRFEGPQRAPKSK